MSAPEVNIGPLIEERVLRAIYIGLEERHESVVRFAQALGIDGEELLRCCTDPDDLEKSLNRIYAEPFEDRRDAIAEMVPDIRDVRIHPTGATLLEGLGVNVWDLAFLSAWSEESVSIELPGGNCAGLYWVRAENRTSITVHLGEHVSWDHGGNDASYLNVGLPIPDTLKLSLVGRRLSDVVDHPIIIPLDISIKQVSNSSDGTVVLTLSSPRA